MQKNKLFDYGDIVRYKVAKPLAKNRTWRVVGFKGQGTGMVVLKKTVWPYHKQTVHYKRITRR